VETKLYKYTEDQWSDENLWELYALGILRTLQSTISSALVPSSKLYANTYDVVVFMYQMEILLKLYLTLIQKNLSTIGLTRISQNTNQISKKAQLPQFRSLSTATLDHLQRPLFLHHSAKNQYLFTNNSRNNQKSDKRRFKNKPNLRRVPNQETLTLRRNLDLPQNLN
jgi:hypothetical protein